MAAVDNIITVTDEVAQAGAVVYWSLSGATESDELEIAWRARNLDPALLPESPSPETALRRAMREQAGHRRLVRSSQNGWVIVDETDEAGGLTYTNVLTCSLNKIGRLETDYDEQSSGGGPELVATIDAAFLQHQDSLAQHDISTWLVDMAKRCQAVALRDRGGIYFIPAHTLEHWQAITGALKDASEHACFEIPALQTEQAVDAILDAVTREAAAAAHDMEVELEEGDLKQRALQTRERRCEEVMAKLKSYESLLGRNLGNIAERLGALQADLAAATLAQMGEL